MRWTLSQHLEDPEANESWPELPAAASALHEREGRGCTVGWFLALGLCDGVLQGVTALLTS